MRTFSLFLVLASVLCSGRVPVWAAGDAHDCCPARDAGPPAPSEENVAACCPAAVVPPRLHARPDADYSGVERTLSRPLEAPDRTAPPSAAPVPRPAFDVLAPPRGPPARAS